MSLPVLSRSFIACRIDLAASAGTIHERSLPDPTSARPRGGKCTPPPFRGERDRKNAGEAGRPQPPTSRRNERQREDGRADPFRRPPTRPARTLTRALRRQASASSGRVHPLHVSARQTQPLEPILFPKLRIYFADFPYLHCSIDQRLLTLETCCGYEYDRRRKSFTPSGFQGPSRAHRTPQDVWCFTGRGTLSPGKPISG